MSFQTLQGEVNEHEQQLGQHNNSISLIGSENNEQRDDLKDLRNKSQQLNKQLNNSIYQRMMENLHYRQSTQNLNNTVNELKAENEQQNQLTSNLSDHMNRLEDQQNVSSIQFVLETLRKNQVLLNLNNSLRLLHANLNTSVNSLNSKNEQQDLKIRRKEYEITGLIRGMFIG